MTPDRNTFELTGLSDILSLTVDQFGRPCGIDEADDAIRAGIPAWHPRNDGGQGSGSDDDGGENGGGSAGGENGSGSDANDIASRLSALESENETLKSQVSQFQTDAENTRREGLSAEEARAEAERERDEARNELDRIRRESVITAAAAAAGGDVDICVALLGGKLSKASRAEADRLVADLKKSKPAVFASGSADPTRPASGRSDSGDGDGGNSDGHEVATEESEFFSSNGFTFG